MQNLSSDNPDIRAAQALPHSVSPSGFPSIKRSRLETLQANLGYRCNQTCNHCHVAAGPTRTEMMDKTTVDWLLRTMEKHNIQVLDLTGGAPEMNEHFRDLVIAAGKLGVRVIDRCNLSILSEPDQKDLARFLAKEQVEVVASMPCYQKENVDKQRGKGVFDLSIAGLKKLNELGYGDKGSNLSLNLVYNPAGPTLPPSQESLETAYKKQLYQEFGIKFNQLFVMVNMPIRRFESRIAAKGQLLDYKNLLKDSFSPDNLAGLMCRSLISVDWQGFIYDCDFNQMLDMPLKNKAKERLHLSDLMDMEISGNKIHVDGHCFGCTAGQGSSCQGALVA
ncbi:MAG: arsenosugar biosynthesis radical SAM protein ArsS [Magnetococcales bacterium]|nr:arsenosugar biosynthesis radical SAM protein ArsS [Magnetococcales bacterium]